MLSGRFRPWPRSVRARAAVAAGLAGAVLFVAGAVWIRHVVYTERQRAARLDAAAFISEVTDVLDGDWLGVESEGSLARLHTEGVPNADGSIRYSFTLLDDQAFPYLVVAADGQVVASSRDLRGLRVRGPTLVPPLADTPAYDQFWLSVRLGPKPPGSDSRLGARTYPVIAKDVSVLDPTQPLVLGKGSPRGEVVRLFVFVLPFDAEQAVRSVDHVLLPSVPAAVLLVTLVAWFATDRALRPVERMRAEAAEITATDLDRRLQIPDSRDHLTRLAVTFNHTLDRLAAAARSQQQFVADAAHELRTPVGSLRAVLEVALAAPGGAGPDRAVLRDAASEARRLHRLTEDLLLLSRLEANPPAPREPVDLAALARRELADRGRVGPVRFVLDTPDPPAGAVVAGHPGQLGRLLTNLLDNAERYARSAVTVTVARAPADGVVLLAVADDGPGVPEADRDRIFDRFTRLDEARTRDTGGTGLGLAIARDICVGHGGSLTLAQSNGGGARFVAHLPVRP